MSDLARDHRTASDGFLHVAEGVSDWAVPTPCSGWDARGIVEHVIAGLDVMVLGPAGRTPERPDDDPVARWTATAAAVEEALADPGVLELDVEIPGMGTPTVATLGPILTTDVLIHTWDLARAVGQEVALDPALCEVAFERAAAFGDGLAASGMFAPKVDVADDAPLQDRLLGLMGRDPAWQPPA